MSLPITKDNCWIETSRVAGDVAADEKGHPGEPVPIDLFTASASGFDPDITPAAAEFQLERVASAPCTR